jgi:serine/threonine protein kinase
MSTLAGYTISGQLHQGSFTAILSGSARDSGAPVVIKIARAEYPPSSDLARLRHEYLLLRSLNVPGVVKALGIERYGNGLALILERVRGQPLSTWLRAQRPDLITVVHIAIALSEILHGLHECGVSHRDIKPHSIRTDGVAGGSDPRRRRGRWGRRAGAAGAAERSPRALLFSSDTDRCPVCYCAAPAVKLTCCEYVPDQGAPAAMARTR